MSKKKRKDMTRYKSKIRKQQLKKIKLESKETVDSCGITDDSLARMKCEMLERYGIESNVIRDRRLEKMSDILLEYGEPLLETIVSNNKAEYEKAIMMLMMIWNCAIIQEEPKGWNEAKRMLKPLMFNAESKSVVRYMLERKQEMFPDNKRMIMNYELHETTDGFHLSVASTIPDTAIRKFTN